MPKVPNTDTFSLTDVINAVVPTTNDLQDCVNDANVNHYNPLYYSAPATSMLEFRDYGLAAASGNFDSIHVEVIKNSADPMLWTRVNYAYPYLWHDWLGQGMWKYDHFSAGSVRVLNYYRPFSAAVGNSGDINKYVMNTYWMYSQLSHNIMHLDIRGVWMDSTGSNLVTLKATGYRGTTPTVLDTVTVSVPTTNTAYNQYSTYGYKYLGYELAVFKYNATTATGYFDVNNTYNYRGTNSTLGTKTSGSTSTILRAMQVDPGDSAITDRGFVYKTTDGNNLEIGQTGVTKVSISGTANGEMTYTLSRSTTIWYRAFITNSAGTAYGEILVDSIDGLGTAALPTPTEILTVSRSGSTITVTWGLVDSGLSREYLLEHKIGSGNWQLSLNGRQTDDDDTVTVSTTGVYYYFRVKVFNMETDQYEESEERSFYVS